MLMSNALAMILNIIYVVFVMHADDECWVCQRPAYLPNDWMILIT